MSLNTTSKLGEFEGTWEILLGSMVGSQLKVIKVETERYKLELDGKTFHDDLTLDKAAFTLKNNHICISLGKDHLHLFGIEWDETKDPKYQVWISKRKEGGSLDLVEPQGVPYWRVGQEWSIKNVAGEVPVEKDNKIAIEEASIVELNDYHLVNRSHQARIDNLDINPSNCTLDGAYRTVASWDRRGESNPSCIFALVTLSQEIEEKIEQILNDPNSSLQGIKDLLKELTDLMPFEIDMMAEIYNGGSGGPGVWGAEEGGG